MDYDIDPELDHIKFGDAKGSHCLFRNGSDTIIKRINSMIESKMSIFTGLVFKGDYREKLFPREKMPRIRSRPKFCADYGSPIRFFGGCCIIQKRKLSKIDILVIYKGSPCVIEKIDQKPTLR